MQYMFVGEKRSARAIKMGVTWADGRLAAKTLHQALRRCGIEPSVEGFINLYVDGPGYVLDAANHQVVRKASDSGVAIVGLGKRVQRDLDRLGIKHRGVTHPAARGLIRKAERYSAHVAMSLGREVAA